MKRIGIICKWGRTEPSEIIRDFVPWLHKRGLEVHTDSESVDGSIVTSFEEMPGKVDMGIVLGGDGTMLGAARLFSRHGIPLLGVNLGGLGFITEVAADCLYGIMEEVLDGQYRLENRIMLSATIMRGGKGRAEFVALNDIVVNKGHLARIIDLEAFINGKFVNLFRADGLIICTPTGSTAYNLSAGGPILYPTIQSLVITPVCPHTLSNRPIVVPDDVEIEVKLRSHGGDDVILTYDGIVAEKITVDDLVVVRRASHVTTFVMPSERSHFEVLREKLHWGGR